jgi:exodeoxyribonuclease VII small subunit
MAEIKFEEALKKLEKIVQDLERGDITLDEALKKYQEGVELARLCSQRLDQAKKKIDILTKNKKGEFELKPEQESKD